VSSAYSTHLHLGGGVKRGLGRITSNGLGWAPSGVQGRSPWTGDLGAKPARSGGLGAVPPAESRGRALAEGVLALPPEAESFSLHKYLTFARYEVFMQKN